MRKVSMRLLLVTLNAKYIHSSLALRYLGAVGRAFPFRQDIAEFTINDRPHNIAAEIYRQNPDIVAFSCYIWNLKPTMEVAALLKKVKPELLIICGGPEVSFETEAFMEAYPQVDLVIRGEGEVPWNRFLTLLAERERERDRDSLLDPSLLARVPGLAYRTGRAIRLNPSAPLMENLDLLPSPYDEHVLSSLADRIVYYEGSRGCPFACSFCLSSTTRGVRYFSLDRIKEDITRLLKAGVREIKFVDRTFNANKETALAIWEFLVSLRPQARFYFEIAGDRLDEDMLDFLSRVPSGLFQLEIGVQTVNNRVNRLCHRYQSWERLARNVRRLLSYGNIRLHLDLIAGLPEENYASFAHSFNGVYSLRPQEIQLGFLKLLKGTALRREAAAYGYIFLDEPPYEVLASRDLSYEEMLRLHRIADLIEKYWNSHLADHALKYLESTCFTSPFAFYEALARWWEDKGLHRRGHSRVDLYNHLAAFAAGYRTRIDLSLFYHLLKFELCRHDRSRRWPHWAPPSPLTERQRSDWMDKIADPAFRRQHLPELAGLTSAELRRHGYIELFPCRPEDAPARQPTLVYFYYGPPGSQPAARVYYLSPSGEASLKS
ncbi:MAG: B12-binding domain-containing radical SAM protein [Thermoanaerobacteraceae bacterium]|nr:B12-binding domain-containing radical SAM protein [Thermoanaerobacteraceae bacterium]